MKNFFKNIKGIFTRDKKERERESRTVIQKNNIVHGDCVGGDLIKGDGKKYRAVSVSDMIKSSVKKNKIIIDGKEFIVEGNSCDLVENTIIFNGKIVECGPLSGIVSIKWEGPAASINSSYSIECKGNVGGDVNAEGNVECENVDGDVNAEGSVQCENVEGDINAEGNVIVKGNVVGDINADGDVIYGR